MGGNYERGMYNQLMEVMARLDMVEKEHKKEVFRLKDEISDLKKENQRLLDENAHLKNIINHNSSNTSRPPSTDQKGGKAVNTYHGRQKTSRKAGGQNGHKGTTLTKAEVEEKIRSGRCRHEIKTIGNPKASVYVTKYIVDLNVETVITEVRIYADKDGNIPIPPECRSDVVYGANVKALAVGTLQRGRHVKRPDCRISKRGRRGCPWSFRRKRVFLLPEAGGSIGGKRPAFGGVSFKGKSSGDRCNDGDRKRETELYTEFQHGEHRGLPRHEQQIDPSSGKAAIFAGVRWDSPA